MKRFLLIFLILFSQLSIAETVSVKYFGTVDLDKFECVQTVSSFVNRICHNSENRLTVVLLRTTYYAYCAMPNRLIEDWIDAPSKGRFYNVRVKGRFRC